MNTQPEDRPLADLVADLMQPLMAYAALLEKAVPHFLPPPGLPLDTTIAFRHL